MTAYQDAKYAARYTALVEKVRRVEEKIGGSALTDAVARYFFKLMAYKDEYEVARLYTETNFVEKIASQFEGDYKLNFYLAPPLFSKKDANGHLRKKQYGPWIFTTFKWLAKLRKLRGTPLDIFGYSKERKIERALIIEYEEMMNTVLGKLTAENLATAVALASIPEEIRGYGHVKEEALLKARARQASLLEAFKAPIIPIRALA